MGTLKKGINGGISGKVGNIVGAYWRDIYYVRSLPVKVNNPRTEAQVKQRNRFTATIDFLKTITPFIRVGFQEYSNGRMTAFNAATSYNIKNAAIEINGSIKLNYPKVLVTRGSLINTSDSKTEIIEDRLQFSWDATLKGNARPDDLVMLLVYNSTKKEAIYTLFASVRVDSIALIHLPSTWSGNTIHPYLSFRRADGSLVSDSLYIECFSCHKG